MEWRGTIAHTYSFGPIPGSIGAREGDRKSTSGAWKCTSRYRGIGRVDLSPAGLGDGPGGSALRRL